MKNQKIYRRSPQDIKWGRTFRRLSKYDLCRLGSIGPLDITSEKNLYLWDDDKFDEWLFLGEN